MVLVDVVESIDRDLHGLLDSDSQLQKSLNLNLAQAGLKTGDWELAVQRANLVLAAESENAKALFRRASALIKMEEFDQVLLTEEASFIFRIKFI